MGKTKFVLNRKGVREVLKSPQIAAACMERARSMQQAAGEGYVAEERNYPERKGAAVYPATREAYYDNLENNTLEKVGRLR